MKALVIVPTYNERENIELLVQKVLKQHEALSFLVIDDASPDGTGEIADRLAEENDRVHVLHRRGKLGLGTINGERTWGGLVGMSGNPGFVDGSSISVPRFAFVDTDGNWAVEAEGVSPDIRVWDTPHLIARGEEPMLERAVAHLLEELQKPQYRKPQKPAGAIRRPPPE